MSLSSGAHIVCITGMHRSGTSMVARVAERLGVYLGPPDRLLPPRPDNPEGFFEHADLGDISDQILRRFGGCWHELAPLPDGWELSPSLDDLRERARAIESRDFGGQPLWGWKDPRAAITLPFWRALFGRIDVVVCLRNAVDTARSLAARDAFPIEKGLRLWAAYTASALVNSTGARRLMARYEAYLDDAAAVRNLAEWLPQGGTPPASARIDGAVAAICPALRHHATPLDEPDDWPWADRALWERLRNHRGRCDLEAAAHAVLQDRALRHIIEDRERQLAHIEAVERPRWNDAVERLQTEIRDLDRTRQQLESCLTDAWALEPVVQELERALAAREAQRDEQQRLAVAIASVEASPTWRVVRAARWARRALRRASLQARGGVAVPGRPRPRDLAVRPLGVNVAGYLCAESGMGEAARASIRALQAAGIPVALNNQPGRLREHDRSFTTFQSDNPHAFNLIHLNADNMSDFERQWTDAYFANRYTIGFWFWELEEFRADWRPAFQFVNEVWVATDFTRQALIAHAPPGVPVTVMPPAVQVSFQQLSVGRDHFGIPTDRFVFLYMFDVSSQLERKNPEAALQAFRSANLADRATLVLKFTNSGHDPEAVRRLHALADGLPVLFIDGYTDRSETHALLACADAYLSLHRAEGFGLTLAEAMALGRPVIATGYSGNLQFMTTENSLLIGYRLVEIERDHGPYLRGFRWADPELSDAAEAMRQLVETPDRGRVIGRRAAADIEQMLGPAASASRILDRLQAIRGARP